VNITIAYAVPDESEIFIKNVKFYKRFFADCSVL